MTLKLNFFYNQGRQGWSETYYHPSTNPQAVTAGFKPTFLRSLVSFRAQGTSLYAVRARDVNSPFKSFTQLIDGGYKGNTIPTGDVGPDVVSTTCVVKLSSDVGTKRRLFLRGMNDAYVLRDVAGNDTFLGVFRTAVVKMLSQLRGEGLLIRSQVVPPEGALAYVRVSLLSPVEAGTQTRLSYTPVFGFQPAVGMRIILRGFSSRDLPHFPRVAIVTAFEDVLPVSNLSIKYKLPGGVSVGPENMKMGNLLYAYQPITEYSFERFSSHKTGRPFGQLAGR